MTPEFLDGLLWFIVILCLTAGTVLVVHSMRGETYDIRGVGNSSSARYFARIGIHLEPVQDSGQASTEAAHRQDTPADR